MGSILKGESSAALLEPLPVAELDRVVIDLTDAAATSVADILPESLVGPRDTATGPSLAVIMPVYNEEATVRRAVEDVLSVEFPCRFELIVVDDGSTDGTARILESLSHPRLTVLHHEVNRGKGAALRTGAAAATTTHLVPFDADLEYSASDLLQLLEPVMEGDASVVYGTRLAGRTVPHQSFIYAVGNAVMTGIANRLYGSAITDLHTCLKLVPCDLFRAIPLLEEGFGLDTELTAWLLRSGASFREVPITYRSRSRAEGKKIGWRDCVACLHILLLIRLQQAPL